MRGAVGTDCAPTALLGEPVWAGSRTALRRTLEGPSRWGIRSRCGTGAAAGEVAGSRSRRSSEVTPSGGRLGMSRVRRSRVVGLLGPDGELSVLEFHGREHAQAAARG